LLKTIRLAAEKGQEVLKYDFDGNLIERINPDFRKGVDLEHSSALNVSGRPLVVFNYKSETETDADVDYVRDI